MPNTSYDEFKDITDEYYKTGIMPSIQVFVDLLKKFGISIRNKDGNLHEATFSVPQSVKGLVLGIRYEKNNRTFSEDLFLFEPGKAITPGYKGKLEGSLKEYKDTHKGSPVT